MLFEAVVPQAGNESEITDFEAILHVETAHRLVKARVGRLATIITNI